MTDIPTISDDLIRARVGDQSYERGRSYFRNGAISAGRRQGSTLKALCSGSRPQPYRVEVTFATSGIVGADCSCPVGDGGYCKHLAALLLTWEARPEAFVEVESVDASLERRDRSELIELVKQMLRRQPDLESLLELPLPAAKRETPASGDQYRREADAILQRVSSQGQEYDDTDDYDETDVAAELLDLVAIGNDFIARADYASGAAVFQAVSESIVDSYDDLDDQEGEIGAVIGSCVEGLGKCLAKSEGTEIRSRLLAALLNLYKFDIDLGGLGFADAVPHEILSHATTAERTLVATQVRALLQTNDSSGWARSALGGFLLDLLGDDLDEVSYLAICRETGRTEDLVRRLLAVARLEEAVRAVSTAGDHDLLGMADIFIGQGHADIAERLVAERADVSGDSRLLDWLRDRFAAREDWESALSYSARSFRRRMSREGYKQVRELAERVGRWQALRPELIDALKDARQQGLLIQIHLDEGEHALALDALRDPSYRGYSRALGLDVAAAVRQSRPRDALEVYRAESELLIATRNRDSYAEACKLLVVIRDIYRDLTKEADWADYVLALRVRYRTLRALKEELDRAGL